MNLADPELELIDPTPNIHSLFVHFDDLFFWTKLMGRALVRWSKRMYSSAGVCSYEGRGGLCDIALSEPLLKLRPRKDLIETLLHEMIHAFLFITNKDNDRDGHGPNFQAHMHRINRAAGLNISIYHDFHDEVALYLTHWWRCNGKCQKMKPYFGIVRRSANRAPGPYDIWWSQHTKMCGGTFVKIKEPEKLQKATKKPEKPKINANITKYVNNNNNVVTNKNIKDIKDNKGVNKNIAVPIQTKSPDIINLVDSGRKRTNSVTVVETVRNVWANKQIPSCPGTANTTIKPTNRPGMLKHKNNSVQEGSPPAKFKKIDDHFKNNASSILKDVYGEEFMITQSANSPRLKAVTVSQSAKVPPVNVFVTCPSCNTKVYSNDINKHLDECLNKDIIEKLSKGSIPEIPNTDVNAKISIRRKSKDCGDVQVKVEIKVEKDDKSRLKNIVGNIPTIPPFRPKIEDLSKIKKEESAQTCLSCGEKIYKPIESHLEQCLGFFDDNTTIPEEGISELETVVINDDVPIKTEPGSSKALDQKCPCCGEKIDKPIELHLDECLSFFNNNDTLPTEGGSVVDTIVIDDDEDDKFDESQTFNATGTKSPCPCCLVMIEIAEMNVHLDICLSKS